MMRTLVTTAAALLASIPALAQQENRPDPFAGIGFQGPECVRYDRSADRVLISNVNGEFTAADDNGFISRIGEGPVNLRWIDGAGETVTLNAPKGMELHDGRLYVSDIDHMRVFDLASGEPVRAVRVPGAVFLNDLAIASDGTVFITDSGTAETPGAVYAISGQDAVEKIVPDGEIARPNGIDLDEQGRLWIASFGSDEVVTVAQDGDILERHRMPSGQLDGLVVRPSGDVLVSSWEGGSIIRISPDGATETLVTGLTQPACFAAEEISGEQVLLIPQVERNKVTVVPLSATPLQLPQAPPDQQSTAGQTATQPTSGLAEAPATIEPSITVTSPGATGSDQPPQDVATAPGMPAFGSRVSARHGPYLIDGDGRTLYLFGADRPPQGSGTATIDCTETCAKIFPPVIVDSLPQAGEGVLPGLLGTVERPDGRLQATYGGWPLYRYVGDRGAGKAAAADFGKPQFGGEWRLVGLDGRPADEIVYPDDRFSKLDFQHPECVRYQPDDRFYVVSNVNGGLTERDNNGFITRIDKNGMTVLRWIEGGQNGVTLHAPAGMQIEGGRLYVADIDHLRVFDTATGNPLRSVAIPGAQLLNDLAVGEDAVYITDSGTKAGKPGAVYKVTGDGSVTKIVPGRVIARPNGIDFDDQGRLHVAEFAGDQVVTISTTGEILGRTKLDAGQLDGLLVRPGGDVLVSSWNGRHIVRIGADGSTEVLVTGLKTPACFDVEEKAGETVLLIPELEQNRVTLAPLPARSSPPAAN